MKSVDLYQQDPNAQNLDIQRQQQLAQMLYQQGADPNLGIPDRPMGVASPLSVLAKGLMGYMSAKSADRALALTGQRDQADRAKQTDMINALAQRPQQLDSVGQGDAPVALTSLPTRTDSQAASQLATALHGLPVDQGNQFLAESLAKRALPQQGFTGELGPGHAAWVNGQVVASVPDKPSDELSKLNDDHARGLISDADYIARRNMLTSRVSDMSPVAKAKADLQAGKISQAEFNAIYAKETHLPPDSQVVQSVDESGKPTLNLISTVDRPGVPAGGIIRKNVGVPASSNSNSARAQQFNDRVVSAAGEATKDITNITLLPFGSDTGIMGIGAHPGGSIFSTVASNLKNRMSSQEVQSYNTTIPGLAASIAQVESQGLAPSKGRMDSFNGLMLQDGDTGWTKLEKMANLRQNVEQGVNAKLTNPQVPPEQKETLRNLMAELQSAIPYTFADVQKLKQSKDPNATIGDYIKQQGLSGSAPAATAQPTAAPPAAIAYLKANPGAADAFKAKYGYLP